MLSDTEMVVLFKALGDENRLQILKQLCNGEKCACKLLEALNISQPTLSHHMKLLCDAGIVNGRKEGKWMHYSIHKERIDILAAWLHALSSAQIGSDSNTNDRMESL